jgi:SulP family sulfate permease
MRGRSMLGATFFTVLMGYAERLAAVEGRLYVSGIDPVLMAQAHRTGTIAADAPVQLYEASPIIGESSLQAFHDATAWSQVNRPDAST